MNFKKINLLILIFILFTFLIMPFLLNGISLNFFSIENTVSHTITKIVLLLILLLFIKRNYSNIKVIYISLPKRKHILFAIFLGILLQPVYIFTNKLIIFTFSNKWLDNQAFLEHITKHEQNFSLSYILMTGLIAVIGEEVLFRGILLERLKASQHSLPLILFISSLWFTLVHLDIQVSGYAFIVGALFALMTIYTKSIVPAIIVHFMLNEVINILLYFSSSAHKIYITISANPFVLIGSIILTIAIFSFLYVTVNKDFKDKQGKIQFIDRYSMIIVVIALIFYSLQLIDWLK